MLKDGSALIVAKESWGHYHLLRLHSPLIAEQAHPGQFLMVRISPHPYPLLRRAFSIHSRNNDTVEIFLQEVGIGTELLARKIPGETLDLLGPLGKGFRIPEKTLEAESWLVGGGRGVAPLFFLAQALRSRGGKAKFFYGGKSFADLPLKDKLEKSGFPALYSTDDGSFGFHGFISDLFAAEIERSRPDHIFACGPEPMMAKVSRIASSQNIAAQFSLESIMGCGFGACWGCVRKINKKGKSGWVKICQEGPVFSCPEIAWDGDS